MQKCSLKQVRGPVLVGLLVFLIGCMSQTIVFQSKPPETTPGAKTPGATKPPETTPAAATATPETTTPAATTSTTTAAKTIPSAAATADAPQPLHAGLKKGNPFPAATDLGAQGKVIYQTNCLACHGATGKGDGSAASSLETRPADFAKTVPGMTDAGIFEKITDGKKPMPSFAKLLTADERWHVVNYLRTFK